MSTPIHESLFRWDPPTSNEDENAEQGVDFAVAFLETGFQKPVSAQSTLNTPPPSSPSNEVNASPSQPTQDKALKRIRFDSVPDICGYSAYDDPNPAPASLLRSLQPSRELKPSKSILKPYDKSTSLLRATSDDSEALRSPHQFASFIDMLESIVKQLAGGGRGAKLDAYNTLCNSLRAYQHAPDSHALVAKLPLLESFIQRDMTLRKHIQEPLDSRLVTLALKLAMILFGEKCHVAARCSEEFSVWLMDDAVTVIEYKNVSKELFKFYLGLLSLPQLCSRAMNIDRAKRILVAFTKGARKITGDSILEGELRIYSRLVDYAKSFMGSTIREWLPRLMHDMLSNSKEISNRAIEVSLKAATAFGSSKVGSEAMHAFLNESAEVPKTNFDHMYEALLKNTSRKEAWLRVPRVWTVIVLFLRSNSHELENWPLSARWLLIMQKCFNHRDIAVQKEGWTAWNQYIRSIDPNSQTRIQTITILSSPIIGTLSRNDNPQDALLEKDVALSSFALLLYYAFRPPATAEQIKLYWNKFVRRVVLSATTTISKMKSSRILVRICKILASALSESTLKTWSPQKSYERIITEKEIPRLDPQWIRQNVLEVATLLKAFLGLEAESQFGTDEDFRVARHQLWSSLLKAIFDAGKKEINVTRDAKAAIAAICATICDLSRVKRITSVRLDEDVKSRYISHCWELVKQTTNELDASLISQPAIHQLADGHFEGASTPTRTEVESRSKVERPIVVLTREIASMILVLNEDETSAFDEETFRTCLESCSTDCLKLELLTDCVSAISPSVTNTNANEALIRGWEMLMQLVRETLPNTKPKENGPKGSYLVHEYQSAVEILQTTLRAVDVRIWETSVSLLRSIRWKLDKGFGRGGVMLILTVPFLRTLDNEITGRSIDSVLLCAAWLLENAIRCPTQMELSEACKSISTGDVPASDGAGWFNFTCGVVDKLLCAAYTEQSRTSWSSLRRYLQVVASFAHSSDCVAPEHFVHVIQRGLALWAKDESQCISTSALNELVHPMWASLCQVIQSLSCNDEILQKIQGFFIAGFQSRNEIIASTTISTWNTIYAKVEGSCYPEDISFFLSRLQRRGLIDLNPDALCDRNQEEDQTTDEELFPWLSDTVSHDKSSASFLQHRNLQQKQLGQLCLDATHLDPSTFSQYTRLAAVDSSPLNSNDSNGLVRQYGKYKTSHQQNEDESLDDIPSSPLGYINERLQTENHEAHANQKMVSLLQGHSDVLNPKGQNASNIMLLSPGSPKRADGLAHEHNAILEHDQEQSNSQSHITSEARRHDETSLGQQDETMNADDEMLVEDASEAVQHQFQSEPVLRFTQATSGSTNGDAESGGSPVRTRSVQYEMDTQDKHLLRSSDGAAQSSEEEAQILTACVDEQDLDDHCSHKRGGEDLASPIVEGVLISSPGVQTVKALDADDDHVNNDPNRAKDNIHPSDISSEPLREQKPSSNPAPPQSDENLATAADESSNKPNLEDSSIVVSFGKPSSSMDVSANETRVSESFTSEVKPSSRDRLADNFLATGSSPSSSLRSFSTSSDIVRAVSQSPFKRDSPRVLIPVTDQKQPQHTMALRKQSRSSRSSSAYQDTPAVPKKRKAGNAKSQPPPKRARGAPQTLKAPKPSNESAGTPNMGDSIVLQRSTKDTPSFHEVVNKMRSPELSQESPSMKPGKRNNSQANIFGKNKRKLDESSENDEPEASDPDHYGPTENTDGNSSVPDQNRSSKRLKLRESPRTSSNATSENGNVSFKTKQSPRQALNGKGRQVQQTSKTPVPSAADENDVMEPRRGRSRKTKLGGKETADAVKKTPASKRFEETKKTPAPTQYPGTQTSPGTKKNGVPQKGQAVEKTKEPKQANGAGNAASGKNTEEPKSIEEKKAEGVKNGASSKDIVFVQKSQEEQDTSPAHDDVSDNDESSRAGSDHEITTANVSESPAATQSPEQTIEALEEGSEGENSSVEEDIDEPEASSQAPALSRTPDDQLLDDIENAGQYTSSFSPASMARNVVGRLWAAYEICKKLRLRGSEYEGEREELEDVSSEVQREISRAGRRGE